MPPQGPYLRSFQVDLPSGTQAMVVTTKGSELFRQVEQYGQFKALFGPL